MIEWNGMRVLLKNKSMQTPPLLLFLFLLLSKCGWMERIKGSLSFSYTFIFLPVVLKNLLLLTCYMLSSSGLVWSGLLALLLFFIITGSGSVTTPEIQSK